MKDRKKPLFSNKIRVTSDWEEFEIQFLLNTNNYDDLVLGKFFITPQQIKRMKDVLEKEIRKWEKGKDCFSPEEDRVDSKYL